MLDKQCLICYPHKIKIYYYIIIIIKYQLVFVCFPRDATYIFHKECCAICHYLRCILKACHSNSGICLKLCSTCICGQHLERLG